jgi:KaiC/GvpD/RAD55 family RecA-like ATPase
MVKQKNKVKKKVIKNKIPPKKTIKKVKPVNSKKAVHKIKTKPSKKTIKKVKPVNSKKTTHKVKHKTKILKPIKQKKLSKRVSSGVAGFDKLTEGGFERETVNIVNGTFGSGKTIFSMQFLVDGLKKGEKCIFVSLEEKKSEFFENMRDFGWNLEEYEKKERFFYLEYTPDKIKSMIEEGGGEIEGAVLKHQVSRIVIDTITTFTLLYEDEFDKREASRNLFDILKKWHLTSIITLQEDTQIGEEEPSSIEFGADSTIIIYFIRKGQERERYLEISKMRGTNHSTKIHKLELTKSGFKITRKTRSR